MQTKAAFGMRFHEVSSFFLKTSPPQPWRWIPRHDCCAIRDRMATHGTGQRMSPHVTRIHVQSKHTTEDGTSCWRFWKIMESWNFSWVMGCRWAMLKIIQGVIVIYFMLSFVILTIVCLSLWAASDRWPSLSQDWTTPLRCLKSPAFLVPKDGNLLGKLLSNFELLSCYDPAASIRCNKLVNRRSVQTCFTLVTSFCMDLGTPFLYRSLYK